MSIDVDVLTEAYSVLIQYVPSKDRQEAADALMSVVVDLLGDTELHEFAASDSTLKKALKEYVGEDENLTDDD